MKVDSILDNFGKKIVAARDDAINTTILTIEGSLNGKISEYFRKKTSTFSSSELENLKDITSIIVDDAVYNVIRMLYESRSEFSIDSKLSDTGESYNLQELSDGFHGDLLGKDGWIDKYGKYISVYNEI